MDDGLNERASDRMVENIPGLVATLLPDGRMATVNQQVLGFLGIGLEELPVAGPDTLIHPDDRAQVTPMRSRALASGEPYRYEARYRRFDGVWRWMEVRGLPVRDAAGRVLRWYVLLSDIDERRSAQERLRLSEAFLAEGQRLARLGNFSWLVAEGEIECSVEFLRVYGIEQGTPLTLEQFVERGHPEDRPLVQHTLDRARRGEADLEYEHRLLLPDGSIKHVHMVAHRSDDASGRLRYIGAVQDVTQRRLADAALDRARADLEHVSRAAAMNALTASIAHEINQPLSGIVTNAGTCLRMLDAVPPNVEGARETARRTIRDGLRASEMIARLKALFSRGELAMEPFDLNDAAREVVVLMLADLQDNHIVLKPEFGNDLPPVAGDRLQVQQVILNLLRNAMDAMIGIDDRPRLLTIRTEREPGDRVRLTVRDAGPGVDAQAMDKLFRAFHSTKPGGMGIGLSVSRSIIERHQGRIWAEPNVGPGATFAFSIPLRPDQA